MRLFVSVDLDGLAAEVADAQAPFADLPGLTLTDPENAHLTLKFLGDGPGGGHDLDALEDALRTAVVDASVGPFDATFAGLGVFPSMEYIRVVWLGVDDGDTELTRLHEAIETRTTDLGYDAESHAFTPHVTLARMKHAAAKNDVQRYVDTRHPVVGTLRVDEIRLTESTLTPDGPTYETVTAFQL